MASLSEMLVQSAIAPGETRDPNAGSGIQVGAQIAMHAQNLQLQQQQLLKDQEALKQAKMSKFVEAVEKGQQYTGKAQSNYYNKFLPQFRNSLGLQDVISDDALAFNGASPEMIKAQGILISQVRRRVISQQQALEIYHDPQKMASMFNISPEALNSSPLDKNFIEELGKAETTSEGNNAIMQKQANEFANAGNVSLSKDLGQKYGDWVAGGGKAGMQSSLTKLNEVANALATGKVKTGSLTTKIPWLKSDDVQSMVNENMVNFKSEAQSALNNVLRATLGPQFTEKEGERTLNQVWDDRQKPSVNAAKIKQKIAELKANVSSTEATFKRFGFIKPGDDSALTPNDAPKTPTTENTTMQDVKDVVAPAAAPGKAAAAPAPAADAFSPEKLDDPKTATALAQKINSNPSNLGPIAKRYRVTPKQLVLILGLDPKILGGQ